MRAPAVLATAFLLLLPFVPTAAAGCTSSASIIGARDDVRVYQWEQECHYADADGWYSDRAESTSVTVIWTFAYATTWTYEGESESSGSCDGGQEHARVFALEVDHRHEACSGATWFGHAYKDWDHVYVRDVHGASQVDVDRHEWETPYQGNRSSTSATWRSWVAGVGPTGAAWETDSRNPCGDGAVLLVDGQRAAAVPVGCALPALP